MSSLLEKMKKAGTVKNSAVLSKSAFFADKDMIPTDLPILNIAFSGDIDGGLVSGVTIVAGQSKSFKTLLSLYCLKAYMNKYPESICLFYDSEFGVTPEYLASNGIDADRVIHIPIEHVEQLKFDIVQRLNEINRGDKVFIFVDSLGALASKKEVDDAVDEKSVADMSRAKAIRSFFRITTPMITMKDIPCLIVNHVYSTMELYAKTVIPGGTAVTYSANQIFVISKSQEKDANGLIGWNFTINIEKSRYVREKSKLPFLVTFEGGIQKYSGLLEIAMDGGFVVKPKNGWYAMVDTDTGELIAPNVREKDTSNPEFLGKVMQNPKFKEYVNRSFKLAASNTSGEIDPLGQVVDDEEIDQEDD